MRSWAAYTGLFLLAGCAAKPAMQVPIPPPPPAAPKPSRPAPPGGAPNGVSVPPSDGQGGYVTINSGIGDAEAVWHLRSALNVAALACDRTGKAGYVSRYNLLLARQKLQFAAAYKAESARFGRNAFDGHITQVYNFFAQPPAQAGFCNVAASVGTEAVEVAPEGFKAYALTAMPRLQQPFLDFYRNYERYRVELAAWEDGERRSAPAAPVSAANAAVARVAGEPVSVQFGAYSDQKAAQSAWEKISKRLAADVDGFTARYEPVPGKTLVRLLIGPVPSRTKAISICATASAAGFDCLPIAR
jgi:hypothetical protein